MEWEYKLELNAEENELNTLGRQGWELVAVKSLRQGEFIHWVLF